VAGDRPPAASRPRRLVTARTLSVVQERLWRNGRGPVRYLAEPVSRRARARRLEQFLRLAGIDSATRIVDIGSDRLGLRGQAPHLDITGVDVVDRPEYPGPFVRADATEQLPFEDNEFDLAYSNSVIEHIPVERRAGFARELRRVARGWYVQTPAFEFPIEPHALLPAAHWLPPKLRRRYWRLGATGLEPDEIHLMRRHEIEELFGPAFPERFGPLRKSWICLRVPMDEDETAFSGLRSRVVAP
jgi:methyltransferase family protein